MGKKKKDTIELRFYEIWHFLEKTGSGIMVMMRYIFIFTI